MYITKYIKKNPNTKIENIVQGDKFRISILTSRLIRIEYSNNNKFENSQTKMVLERDFPIVDYKLIENEDNLKIITKDITLRYDKKEFSPYGLSIELNGKTKHPYKEIWHYGDKINNLGGTRRTLDFIDGKIKLDDGLMSEYGISIIDDSNSPIFSDDGWYENRNSNDIDIYVFAYKRDFKAALKDYYLLTGEQPKIPRYSLGNWWSRYYPYNEQTYNDLINKFENEKLPFSVAVLDMDWHLVDIPEKYGSIWTGYTWNNELFPEPERFINNIKNKGYRVTLNIHPSAGVRPFEKAYKEFASSMGIESEKEIYIDFDYKSKKYFENSFKYLYKPNEDIGVDFWWIDWQQSPSNIDENKDALWVLNHYHYNDNQKNNNGLTFSRYSGPGSHRYPVGFSGDVVISWESLDFQPYFTATSSNIGYGWWSHDIGGHRHGYRSDELMLRWIQFGVFSPINRLHSSNSEFLEKEPWNFKEPYRTLIGDYLRLRHKMIPYIHTMNIISNKEGIPLIRPMYYEYSDNEDSYNVKNQYFFGSELIVCPMTTEIDKETQKSSFKVWLPKGNWYDLQLGIKYNGDRNLVINRGLENIGLFFKEGSIVPFTELGETVNDINNPDNFNILIGTGEDGEFNLIEDSLISNSIDLCNTNIKYIEKENKITILTTNNGVKDIPEYRNWKISLYGKNIVKAIALIDGKIIDLKISYNNKKNISIINIKRIKSKEEIEIKFIESMELFDSKQQKLYLIKEFLKQAQMDNQNKKKLYEICESNKYENIIINEIFNFNTNNKVKEVILEFLLSSHNL